MSSAKSSSSRVDFSIPLSRQKQRVVARAGLNHYTTNDTTQKRTSLYLFFMQIFKICYRSSEDVHAFFHNFDQIDQLSAVLEPFPIPHPNLHLQIITFITFLSYSKWLGSNLYFSIKCFLGTIYIYICNNVSLSVFSFSL